jgi:hypothetical protein
VGAVVGLLATVAIILGLISATAPAFAAASDSQTSSANSGLSCTVSVSLQGGKAVVTWTITGATSASIDPLTFDGKVPLKGTQTVDYSGNIIVLLTAKDADGHAVHCRAGAGAAPTEPATGTTGFGDDHYIVTSSA